MQDEDKVWEVMVNTKRQGKLKFIAVHETRAEAVAEFETMARRGQEMITKDDAKVIVPIEDVLAVTINKAKLKYG